MIGRDDVSALRSMRLFFGKLLPAPWNVQLVRREPQVRPLVVVRFVGPKTTSGSAYVRHYVQQVEVFAYPEGVEADPQRSELEARHLCNTLTKAFEQGNKSAGSKSMRIPLYDYSAVADDAFLLESATPLDYLVISNLTGSARQDPEADDLYTVILDLRVEWSDDGDRSRFEGAVLQDVFGPNPVSDVVQTFSLPYESR